MGGNSPNRIGGERVDTYVQHAATPWSVGPGAWSPASEETVTYPSVSVKMVKTAFITKQIKYISISTLIILSLTNDNVLHLK